MAMTRVVIGRKEILTPFDLRAVTLWVKVEFATDNHNHSRKLPNKCFTEKTLENVLKNELTQVAQKPCKNDF